VIRFLVPNFLAALTAFWAVTPAMAIEPQMKQVSDTVVEITGGTGKEAWCLSYGVARQFYTPTPLNPLFVLGEGNRAWYSQGTWLRLIDTERGEVIGRWRFPTEIVALVPEGAKVQVEVEDHYDVKKFRRKLELDPSAPRVPYWPADSLGLYRTSIFEVSNRWPLINLSTGTTGARVTAEQAKKLIPELEEAVQRDPLSPWSQVALGKVLRDIGDGRADEVFEKSLEVKSTDFTERLPISAYLDSIGEPKLAREAFERGYQDFWERGNDPRLFEALICRMFIYAPHGGDWGNVATPHGRELIEQMYELMPYGQGASLAWRGYADYLLAHGLSDEARLWRARAKDASQNRRLGGLAGPTVDILLIGTVACILAVFFCATITYGRYRPQGKLDLAAGRRSVGISRIGAFLNAHYWSRRERVAFIIVVFTAWIGIGLTAQYVEAILRRAALPISAVAGSFGGPVTIARFQSGPPYGLPASPERDLMLAFAYQQDGQTDKAAELYRHLPQFAQSWNNLGVILKEAGKDDEARAAFTRALELDPKLAEPALNLDRPPADFWTEQHDRYLPGKPMLAPPGESAMQAAFLGGSRLTVCLRAMKGPYYGESFAFSFRSILDFTGNWGEVIASKIPSLLVSVLIIYCVALIFLIPSREVSVPPERLHTVWEVLLPGTSMAWGVLGGLAMAAFIYFVLQSLLIARSGTSYFISMIAAPNLSSNYGVPIGNSFADIVRLLKPSWVWVYLAPAVLFAVNLFLVLRDRRRA
jgi:tetratricopeptide (TPR) repeat protein